MESYIRGLIPNLAQLRDMPAAFMQMYSRIAAHKFFFFCDPNKRGWFSPNFWLLMEYFHFILQFSVNPFVNNREGMHKKSPAQ